MFKTKICGVTSVASAENLVGSNVDAVGLNFYEKSKRYVDLAEAKKIVAALPTATQIVGVFVNASTEAILAIAEELRLDYVQLHGDEPPEFLSTLSDLKIIRAFRTNGELATVREYLAQCENLPAAILLDAYDPEHYGGTGKSLNWSDVREREWLGELPLVLAGGLRPENVAEAIEQADPFAVDTASGVEVDGQAGVKDQILSQAFVKAATTAFSA